MTNIQENTKGGLLKLAAWCALLACCVFAQTADANPSFDSIMFRKRARAKRATLPEPVKAAETAPAPAAEEKAAEPTPAVAEEKAVVPAPAVAEEKKPEDVKPVAEKPSVVAVEKKVSEDPQPESVKPEELVKTAEDVKPAAESANAETPKPEITVPVEKTATVADKKDEPKKAKKPAAVPRDAVITADRTDYDRKEGVVLFDRNVHVDDYQYQMHADRLFLFLDGTNELKRLVAIGRVAITNENKTAYCARATFNKKLGRIVMYSSDEIVARLREEGKKGSEVKGERITFWLDSEQVEVENPVITMPGGFGGKEGVKGIIGK